MNNDSINKLQINRVIEMTKEKLWTKDFISISVISFFIFLAFYILLTALPLYILGPLHEGADKVGLIVTLFLFPAIIIRPFAGRWVSKGSEKKILVYSAVAFFVAYTSISISNKYLGIICFTYYSWTYIWGYDYC